MAAAMLLLAAICMAPVQEPETPPDPVVEALRRFDTLPEEEQELVLEEMRAAVLARTQPVLQAAATVLAHPRVQGAESLEYDPERAFSAKEYAPALKLKTSILKEDHPSWKQICRDYLRGRKPEAPTTWSWDAGRDALLRPTATPTLRGQAEALLRGSWPADARLAACAAGALDEEEEHNARADYFAHHYRDRTGRVFRGISLEAMWGSGRQLEVSDVEAVAWLRTVEGREDVVSPIPKSLHDPIYKRISAGFGAFRDEEVLREALALRLVDPQGALPTRLAAMGDLIDRGWVALRHDPARMAALLEKCADRRELFAALYAADQADLGDESAAEERARHLAARAGFAADVSAAAFDAARAAGLLGFGLR